DPPTRGRRLHLELRHDLPSPPPGDLPLPPRGYLRGCRPRRPEAIVDRQRRDPGRKGGGAVGLPPRAALPSGYVSRPARDANYRIRCAARPRRGAGPRDRTGLASPSVTQPAALERGQVDLRQVFGRQLSGELARRAL